MGLGFREMAKKPLSHVFLMGRSEKPRFCTFKPIGFCEFRSDLAALGLKRSGIKFRNFSADTIFDSGPRIFVSAAETRGSSKKRGFPTT